MNLDLDWKLLLAPLVALGVLLIYMVIVWLVEVGGRIELVERCDLHKKMNASRWRKK